ncbi:MAG: PPC domain-containing DNA-binding protein [Candidatus Helarchaeota archaeon]
MKSVSSEIKRVIFGKIDEDEDLLEGIMQLIKENNISSATFYAIGAVKRATFGFYKNKTYQSIVKNENLEIISCTGNIALNKKTNERIIHCHIVFGDENGNAYGGHVLSGCIVSPIVEITLFELDTQIYRDYDEKTNLLILKM